MAPSFHGPKEDPEEMAAAARRISNFLQKDPFSPSFAPWSDF